MDNYLEYEEKRNKNQKENEEYRQFLKIKVTI